MSASPEAVPPIEDQVEAVFTTDDRAGMEQLDVSLAAAKARETLESGIHDEGHPLNTLREIEVRNDVAQAELGLAADEAVAGRSAEAQHTHAGETEAPGRTLKGSDSLMELMAAPSDYKSRDMGHLMRAVYETEEKKQNPPASKTDSSPQGGVQ